MKRLTGKDDPRLAWRLVAQPEDVQIEGNCSAIDPETDAETAAWIRSELDSGNTWAWATVYVCVTFDADGTEFEGRDSLDCCSYRSEADFLTAGDYYEDMRGQAFSDLCNSMQDAVERGELAKGILFSPALRKAGAPR